MSYDSEVKDLKDALQRIVEIGQEEVRDLLSYKDAQVREMTQIAESALRKAGEI